MNTDDKVRTEALLDEAMHNAVLPIDRCIVKCVQAELKVLKQCRGIRGHDSISLFIAQLCFFFKSFAQAPQAQS
jgi:hypothetical protein